MAFFNGERLYSAAIVVFIGLVSLLNGFKYGVGNLARAGPGFFPVLVGALLILIGVLIIVAPPRSGEKEAIAVNGEWVKRLRPWLSVVAGIFSFIFVGMYAGFVLAVLSAVLISSLGDCRNTLKDVLLIALIVTTAAVGLFSYGIGIAFPLFPWS